MLKFVQYEGGVPCATCGHVYTKSEGATLRASKFPSEILPGRVWLGSFDNASRVELLKAMGITHILNVRRCTTQAAVHCSVASVAIHSSSRLTAGFTCCRVTDEWDQCSACATASPCTRILSCIILFQAALQTLTSVESSLVRAWHAHKAIFARELPVRVSPLTSLMAMQNPYSARKQRTECSYTA